MPRDDAATSSAPGVLRPALLTFPNAAKYLSCSESVLRRRYMGDLEVVTIGKTGKRVTTASLDRLVARLRQAAP